jgi:DNA processing protein
MGGVDTSRGARLGCVPVSPDPDPRAGGFPGEPGRDQRIVEPNGTGITRERMAQAVRLEPTDEAYPQALREARGEPGPLWVLGEIPVRCVAVVGTRKPDLGGLQAARAIARELAEAGWAVVSGGALGCDTAAHEGALEAGGRTVVVLGSGLARPYPRENLGLFLRAAAAGAVVSPFPPEAEALPGMFHRRNRILAALAAAVVVVRAGERSGALSTAEHARRLGRPVLVVPGATTCSAAAGSNLLLREGCAAALDASDVLRAIAGAGAAAGRTSPAGYAPPGASFRRSDRRGVRAAVERPAEEDPLLALIGGGEAAGADELAAASGLPAAEVAARLGRLEIEGRVARLADGRFRGAAGGG